MLGSQSSGEPLLNWPEHVLLLNFIIISIVNMLIWVEGTCQTLPDTEAHQREDRCYFPDSQLFNAMIASSSRSCLPPALSGLASRELLKNKVGRDRK